LRVSTRALPEYAASPLYDDAERVALEYTDCMTVSGREVDDDLFAPGIVEAIRISMTN
jgi:hypothetical protein